MKNYVALIVGAVFLFCAIKGLYKKEITFSNKSKYNRFPRHFRRDKEPIRYWLIIMFHLFASALAFALPYIY